MKKSIPISTNKDTNNAQPCAHAVRLKEVLEINKQLEALVAKKNEKLAATVTQFLEINRVLERENEERKAAESAFLQQTEELREALSKEQKLHKLKSRFVSTASHEFRTPLSSILAAAELIEAYPHADQQEKRQKNVNRIKNAISTLTSILGDILSYSKLEEGHFKLQSQWFLFSAFCEDFLDELKGTLKIGQEIQHRHIGADATLFLDKNTLKNILFNLVSNASKYSDEKQQIECITRLENGTLFLEIKDSGIGIPKEDQPDLFERFFRAHNVENIQGTGLGLNITKKYVDILNGSISFESELGKGTTFFVNLPVEIK